MKRNLQISALLMLGLFAGLASAQTTGVRQGGVSVAPVAAPAGQSLESQVADLRAQIDVLRRVLVIDAQGNVTLRADRDLLLKAGNVLEGSATGDAKLKSGRNVELEAAQDAKTRGRNVRLDANSDLEALGRTRVSVRSEAMLDAEGKSGFTLRSGGVLDARASLIKLN